MKKRDKRENLLKNSKGEFRYLFNWVEGGFNDVWAKNKKVALLKANEISSRFRVNESTMYKCTPSESTEWDRTGNMMCD
jgi:hypothetical protein